MGNVATRLMWPLGVYHKRYVQSTKNAYIKYAHW